MTIPWEYLIGGGISLTALLLFLFLIKRGSIKTKFFEIKSDDKQNLYKIISKSIMISNAIRDIELKERLSAQMEYCEIGIANSQAVLMANFSSMLTARGVKDPTTSKEYKLYGQNIKLLMVEMRYMMKCVYEKMVRMFDYDSMEDPRIRLDFASFKNSTVQTFLCTGTQRITEEWVPLDVLTRDECHQANIPIFTNLGKEIESALQKGLEVQVGYKQRLNSLYKELEDYIQEGDKNA